MEEENQGTDSSNLSAKRPTLLETILPPRPKLNPSRSTQTSPQQPIPSRPDADSAREDQLAHSPVEARPTDTISPPVEYRSTAQLTPNDSDIGPSSNPVPSAETSASHPTGPEGVSPSFATWLTPRLQSPESRAQTSIRPALSVSTNVQMHQDLVGERLADESLTPVDERPKQPLPSANNDQANSRRMPAAGHLPSQVPEETTINITIQRIEVRADHPAEKQPKAKPENPKTAHLSLDEYLKRRNDGSRA